jgi:preprotein translocase subunit YajC
MERNGIRWGGGEARRRWSGGRAIMGRLTASAGLAGISASALAAPLLAQTETAPSRPGGAPLWIGNIFLFGSFILIFYFLILRPQQRRQRDHAKMLEGLKTGDRVLTSGGVYGTVVSVKDDIVNLRIGDNVRIEVAKSAVTSITPEAK